MASSLFRTVKGGNFSFLSNLNIIVRNVVYSSGPSGNGEKADDIIDKLNVLPKEKDSSSIGKEEPICASFEESEDLSARVVNDVNYSLTSGTSELADEDVQVISFNQKGGFAQAYDRFEDYSTEQRKKPSRSTHTPWDSESTDIPFAELFRRSKFMQMGNPKGRIVRGRIAKAFAHDLYVDFGGKFMAVVKKPVVDSEKYYAGGFVVLRLQDLELSSRFLGSDRDLTLLEADAQLIGLYGGASKNVPNQQPPIQSSETEAGFNSPTEALSEPYKPFSLTEVQQNRIMAAPAGMDNPELLADLEIEMMSDVFKRMTNACHKKCIGSKYREGDLTKGESVCLDRCVAKYLDIHERLGKKMTAMQAQDEQSLQALQNMSQPQ